MELSSKSRYVAVRATGAYADTMLIIYAVLESKRHSYLVISPSNEEI